ncbi:MAG: dihydropyrimidine dehydrogenase, partial [Lentisphaeria bacterium]|nr:dihydropyrimidine dehydrogenase [Lentisphaeria bacterium]
MSHPTREELNALAEQQLAALGEVLKPKDRMAIPSQEMPAQDPAVRRCNTSEVALGYTEAQARLEAQRCLRCKNQPCVQGCPVSIHIRDFVTAIAEGDFQQAVDTIKLTSLLPAICGRV